MPKPQPLRDVQRVFWRAIAEGQSTHAAAARAGVSSSSGENWFREAGGMAPLTLHPPGTRYLSLAEREEIALGLAAGRGVREIARDLGRSPSTVSREIRRNSASRVYRTRPDRHGNFLARYRGTLAQAKAERRARRPKQAKLAGNEVLRAIVDQRLRTGWSPQQIATRLRREYPDEAEMQVSHEAIYQALYVQGRGALRRELTRCLRTGRAVRKPRRRTDRRRSIIPDLVSISERPAEAEDRAVPGHWEGDLIIGKDGRSAIGTLVERSTRYCLLLHLPGKFGAEQVRDQMIATVQRLPQHLWRSLTWDRGIEMQKHGEISLATDLAIYFCDPHSPWQRGSNENTNGLLRQYFPKGTNLSVHSAATLDAVATELNGRPRQTLDWDTPAEALNRILSEPFNPTGVAATA